VKRSDLCLIKYSVHVPVPVPVNDGGSDRSIGEREAMTLTSNYRQQWALILREINAALTLSYDRQRRSLVMMKFE